MGRQLVKQPNGRYALWSSIVDHFILYDATPEDVIEFEVEEQKERIRKDVLETVAKLERGEKPSGQFTRTWNHCLGTIRAVHGRKDPTYLELKKIKGL